jgi:hypothetical protein
MLKIVEINQIFQKLIQLTKINSTKKRLGLK